jgi:hypothetical protein
VTERPETVAQQTSLPHVAESVHDSAAPPQVAPAAMQEDAPLGTATQHCCAGAVQVVVPHVTLPLPGLPLLLPLLVLLPPLLPPEDELLPLVLAPPLELEPAGLFDDPPHAIASDVPAAATNSDRA